MDRYSDAFKERALAALRVVGRILPVAREFSVTEYSLRTWAREAGIALAPQRERIQAANVLSQRSRWGDTAKRRAKARKMRAKGHTLAEIARACGYSSEAGAHYAIRDLTPDP